MRQLRIQHRQRTVDPQIPPMADTFSKVSKDMMRLWNHLFSDVTTKKSDTPKMKPVDQKVSANFSRVSDMDFAVECVVAEGLAHEHRQLS